MQTTFWLALSGALAGGLLAGASLDQSVKQLPARHRRGVEAYSEYSLAADLGNGILLYAILGIGASVLAIAAAVVAHLESLPTSVLVSADIAAGLALLHSLSTARAAPTFFSQRTVVAIVKLA